MLLVHVRSINRFVAYLALLAGGKLGTAVSCFLCCYTAGTY